MKNTQKNTSFVGSKTLVEIAKEKLQKKELEMFESEYLPIQEAFKDIPLHLVEKFLIQNTSAPNPTKPTLQILATSREHHPITIDETSNRIILNSLSFRIKLTPDSTTKTIEMIKNKRIFKTLEQIKPVIKKRGAELKKAHELSLLLEERIEKTLSSALTNLPNSLTLKDIDKERFYWLISYEFNFSNHTIHFNSERTYSISDVNEDVIQTEMNYFLEEIYRHFKFVEDSKKEYQCDDQLTLILLKAVDENPNQTVFDYIDYLKGIGENAKNLTDFGALEAYNELYLFIRYERLLEDSYLTFKSRQQNIQFRIIEDEELYPLDPFGDYSFLFPHPLQSFDDATLSLCYKGSMTLDSNPIPTTEKFRNLMSPTGISQLIKERDFTTFEKLAISLPIELSSFVFLEILKKLNPLTEHDVQILIEFIPQHYPFYQPFQAEFIETISTLIPPIYQNLFELNEHLTMDDSREVFRLISEQLIKANKE